MNCSLIHHTSLGILGEKKIEAGTTQVRAFHTNGHHSNKEIKGSFLLAGSAHSLCLILSNARCEAGT